jgi:hypothetical protein
LRKHLRHRFRFGDVAHESNSGVTDLRRNLFDLFGRARSDGDSRALTCESESNGAANAATTACDKRNFSVQHDFSGP